MGVSENKGVPYCGVLIIRILLFRVLYYTWSFTHPWGEFGLAAPGPVFVCHPAADARRRTQSFEELLPEAKRSK